MKIPLLILYLSSIFYSLSQEKIEQAFFYRTDDKIFQVSNDSLITYSINKLNPKIYIDFFSDTSYLTFQNDVKYNGKSSAVKISNNEIYLYSLKRENDFIKVPKISADSANVVLNFYAANTSFLQTYRDTTFQLTNIDYEFYHEIYKYHHSEDLQLPHSEYLTLLNNRISFLKDSLQKKDEEIGQIVNDIKANIEKNDYPAYSEKLFLLLSDSLKSNFRYRELLTYILENQPENYLRLVEEHPRFKSNLIDPLAYTRKHKLLVKSVEGHETGKKMYLKKHRQNRGFAIYAISSYTILSIAFYGGIIYLIVK